MEDIAEVFKTDDSEIIFTEGHDGMAEVIHLDGTSNRHKGKGQKSGHLLPSKGVEQPGARRQRQDCRLSEDL